LSASSLTRRQKDDDHDKSYDCDEGDSDNGVYYPYLAIRDYGTRFAPLLAWEL
jgi:hypothetical protein